jgi:hypothetical protein
MVTRSLPPLQAQAGAVEERAHQTRGALEGIQHRPDLLAAQNDRQAPRSARPDHAFDLTQRAAEHAAVQEEQRSQGLVLGRRGDSTLHSKVRQELVGLPLPHLLGGAPAVKRNEPRNPRQVGLLGPPTVVSGAERLACTLEETGRGRRVEDPRIGWRAAIAVAACGPKGGIDLDRVAAEQRQ